MEKTLGKIADWGGYFGGWLVPIMMCLVVVDVFMRYVMEQPLMISDEFSAYMLVALSYLGLAYTWRQGGHVRITVFLSRISSRSVSWLRLFTLILVFIFMLGMDQSGYKMVAYALQMNLKSSTWLTFPLFWPQVTIFIGFILLTLVVGADILRAVAKIKAGEKVEEINL